jgi:hypothetical protein
VDEIRHMHDTLLRSIQQPLTGVTNINHSNNSASRALVYADQFDRLMLLLSLTEQEREFVRSSVATAPGDDFWRVLADYLEDGNSPYAKRYRAMADKK